ncbi:MAG: Fis family transcriptional regulator [Myxococcaceae bacterium]
MSLNGYQEADLVANRASVIIFGGTEADRRAWAEEAAVAFSSEGPLREVAALAGLPAALARGGGVVFVPNLVALGNEGQSLILQCLLHHEERPKLVLGLPASLVDAMARGLLRDDLSYRLTSGRLDLTAPGLREAIRARRQKAAAEAAKQAARAGKRQAGHPAKPARARTPAAPAKRPVKGRAGKR